MEVNRLTLSFQGTHAHLEKDFLDDYFNKSIQQVRACLILGVIVYGFFTYSDSRLIVGLSSTVLIIRAAIVIPALLGLAVFSYFPRVFKQYWQACLIVMMALGVSGLAAIIALAPPPANYFYHAALVLALIWGYTCVRLRFIWAVLAGWLSVLFYEIAALGFSGLPLSIITNSSLDLIGANLMCMFASYSMEYYSRKGFFLNRLLDTEREKVESANQELEAIVKERTSSLVQANRELELEITERRQTEQALRESEEKYRSVVENAYEGMAIIQDGIVVFCNDRLASILHRSKESILSRPFVDFFHDDDRAMALEQHNNRLAGQDAPGIYSIRTAGQDNKTGWLQVTEAQIEWRGRPATLNFLLDITDLKRAESERNQMEEQLRQARKMESLGTLAGGIAHDFNNILGAMMGYTELSLIGMPEGEKRRHNLEQVLKAGQRAKHLVQQILKFSRSSEQERRPIKIAPVIGETIKLLRATLPTTIEIRQNLAPESGSVMADPTQIHQLLMNLCSNAADSMRDRGGVLEVSLATLELDRDSAEQLVELKPGLYLKLTVTDTGQGMDAATLERIFEPFFTTKQEGMGTGMGLSVVHGIVKSHGGAITASSQPDQGSIFSVYLPLMAGEAGEQQSQDTRPLPTGTESILFVDDEEALVDVGRQVLELLGYQVTRKTNSQEALELFRAAPGDFDLVVTDQTMPGLTGADLSGEILKIRPDIPIILCTGFSAQISPEKAKALGVRRLVMKPLVAREIAEIIRVVLDEKD